LISRFIDGESTTRNDRLFETTKSNSSARYVWLSVVVFVVVIGLEIRGMNSLAISLVWEEAFELGAFELDAFEPVPDL